MSQENVEVVRSVYEAWARDDLPGPAHLFDAQIEYVNPPGAVEPGTRHGLAAFTRAVRDVFEGLETWQIELERFIPAGQRVAVVVRYRAHWRVRGGDVGRPGWEGRALRVVSRAERRPRSRRAFGLGDVAGERGAGGGGAQLVCTTG